MTPKRRPKADPEREEENKESRYDYNLEIVDDSDFDVENMTRYKRFDIYG